MEYQKNNHEKQINIKKFDDEIENFISNNRADFDECEPSIDVWANIDAMLPQQTEKSPIAATPLWYKTTKMRVAAAVLLLLVGGGVGNWLSKPNLLTDKIAIAQHTEGGLKAEDVAKELRHAEAFYNQKVQLKLNQLASFNPDPEVVEDLKQIDEVQIELHRELDNAPSSSREEIIERLMENYKIKLDILERVLNHLQQHSQDVIYPTPTEQQEKSRNKKQQHDTII